MSSTANGSKRHTRVSPAEKGAREENALLLFERLSTQHGNVLVYSGGRNPCGSKTLGHSFIGVRRSQSQYHVPELLEGE